MVLLFLVSWQLQQNATILIKKWLEGSVLMKYKVYEISPKLSCYRGLSLVAAESVEKQIKL